MLYIPTSHLKPGMLLARAVTYNSSYLPLLVVGQRLSMPAIRRLEEFGVPGVYIESRFASDIDAEDFVEPELKQQMTTELKSLYKSYVSQKPLSISTLKSVYDTTESLLTALLSKNVCMMNIVEVKDYDAYTYSHSIYVATLAIMIGMQLGFTRSVLSELAMAGVLHDIGKLEIPLSIVNKPGPLNEEEFLQMKTHPAKAVRRLQSSYNVPSSVLRGIESHHERYDGTGYPRGLAGHSIPRFGRILALADVYDALTSTRVYRRAWFSNEAIEYMMGGTGMHFDHDILKAFLRTVAAYPVGSIVRLSDDSLAVVVENSPDNTLRPTVRLLLPEERKGQQINLSEDRNYLNVTVCGTINESTTLPDDIMKP